MKAQRKGDYLSIKIDDELVQREVDHLKDSLIGKITLAFGDSPYLLEELHSRNARSGMRCYWQFESCSPRKRLLQHLITSSGR